MTALGAEVIPKDPRPRPRPRPRLRLRAWAVDVLLIVLLMALTVVRDPVAGVSWPDAGTTVLAVLAAVALLSRRRWPLPVLGAELVLYAVAAAFGALVPGFSFAVAVAVFTVTNRMPRRAGVIVTVVTVVLVIGLGLVAWRGAPTDPRLVQFALTVVVGSALGDATRSRRERIEAITDRAERAERTREAEARRRVSEERLRIARDLHDTVAHQISVISLNAGVASAALDERPEKARESLAAIRSASRFVLGEIGGLLEVLRSEEDDVTAPGPGLAQLDELTARFVENGLEVSVRVEGDLSRATGAVGVVAYRVVQEALTNAHKHGSEHRAHILLTVADEALTIVVTNPTRAGVEAPAAPGSRLGLAGMRERVAMVRGSVQTGPAPGGWRVAARLPLTQGDAA